MLIIYAVNNTHTINDTKDDNSNSRIDSGNSNTTNANPESRIQMLEPWTSKVFQMAIRVFATTHEVL